ncbi:MAG: OadG family protein [Akkermansiaceae bacterium]|jgi:Na+-transporting methylmalonyl-CoA/oxaloacetate decarboxylase gamma subunit|nr:OadG family protein [Akkermansiaceae bacterium]
MNVFSILAATDKPATSIMDALPHLAGMLMVMVTLTILWGVCVITAKLVKIFIPEPQAAVAPVAKPVATPAATPATPEGIAPEIVAVIAAAVANVTGQPCRIISIKPMSTSWERAGRHSVLTSHRIR